MAKDFPDLTGDGKVIQRLDRTETPMQVDVEGGRVTVRKGDDTVNMEGK